MKLKKLKFKKVKYGSVLLMGGWSYSSNEQECIDEGNVGYGYNTPSCQ